MMGEDYKIKILVAEDSPTIRAMVQYTLEQAGYEVIAASDGIEEVELAYKERPDIILSDIVMPRMTGYQACRLLKDDPVTSQIPIIIMTTRQEESSRFWGLRTGANDYITKPFEPEEILHLLEKIIEDFQVREKTQKKSQVKKIELQENHVQLSKDAPVKKEEIQEIHETQIIARVNELLDKELFRSTLINEVGKLSETVLNFQQVIKAILELFSKVINFQVAGMYIHEEMDDDFFIFLRNPVSSKTLSEFEGRLFRFMQLENLPFSPSRAKKEIFGEQSENVELYLRAFHAIPMRIGRAALGIIAVAGSDPQAFLQDDLQILDFLRPQVSMTLENSILHKRTAALAITDGLTGLSTHRYFQEAIDREIGRAKRLKLTFSFVILDIDNFKSLNDTFGHLEGDKVLREIAKIMRAQVRDTDTVARYGGEEFVVILIDTPKEGAKITAERIREAIETYKFVLAGRRVVVTASLGIATYPDDATIKQELIQIADKALYKAKSTGKNKVCSSEEEEVE